MSGVDPLVLFGVMAGSALLSLLLVPLALRVAISHDWFDRPGGRKTQEAPVPYLGGVAVVTAFAVAVLVTALVRPPSSGLVELSTILGGGVALAAVGLADDLRGISAWAKLAATAAASLVFALVGDRASLFPGEFADAAVAVLWLVGITNAFNLLDNMDGLSAGVAAIAAAWFGVIAASGGQFLVAALALALVGCAAGFLRHNRHPAQIYMGDAGSLFLGFVLAVLGLKLRFPGQPEQVTAFVPVVVLAVPITDTVLVVVSRLIHRRSPFTPGRDHLSHRLAALGLTVPTAVWLLWLAGALAGWAGLLMTRLDTTSGYLLLGLVAGVCALAAGALGRVPVYDNSRGPRIALTVGRSDDDGMS